MNVDHRLRDRPIAPPLPETAVPEMAVPEMAVPDSSTGGGLSVSELELLLHEARHARVGAYAPYSGFGVGAALRGNDGRTVLGVNVENASFGLGMCAERVAVGAAVTAGVDRIIALAVVGPGAVPIAPCGACRQVLAELAHPDLVIVAGCADAGKWVRWTLEELLPAPFGFDALTAASSLRGPVRP